MRLLLLFFAALISLQVQAQRNCAAHHHHEELMLSNPDYARKNAELERFTEQFIQGYNPELMATGEVIIPVVFHIVWNTAAQNISDQRVFEQMKVFNDDFRAENLDTSLIPSPFKPLKGAFNVRFVLANRDPQGNPTTGIVRRQTTRTSFTASSTTSPTAQPMKFTAQGGSDAWDTRSYLNVWVCNLSGGVLGYATFPASAGTAYDGIVLGSPYTGITGASAPFNLGRTGTHEVGHYFNLRHIWGDATNCTASDFVDDTPNQRAASSGCPTFPRTDACTGASPGIMFMNYMDYTNDACMYMFSLGQVGRMQAALSGPRASLLTSRGFVSDVRNDISADAVLSPSASVCSSTVTPTVRYKNTGANDITKFTARYQITGNPVVGVVWTGTLKPDSTVTIAFDPVQVQNGQLGFITVTSEPNDTIDANQANDTLRFSFRAGSIASGSITGDTIICEGSSAALTALPCATGPFSIAAYAATRYVVEEFETNGAPYAGNPITVQISADARPNTLAVLNFGDWESPLPAFLTFNPNPNNPTITVLETRNGFVQGTDTLLWTGSGTYNPCTRKFTVSYGFKNPRTNQVLVPAVKVFTPSQLFGLSYLWSNGSTDSAIVVSPSTTTQYSVTLTNGSCTQVRNVTVVVNNKVTPTFNAIPPICSGATAPVLPTTSSNGVAGTWAPAIVSNTATGTYTFTPETGLCANSTTLEVVVNALPSPAISGSSPICPGESVKLTASGGVTYVWNSGQTTEAIDVTPVTTTTYTVTVTGANGCSAQASETVTVKAVPNLSISGSNSICNGQSTTLTASGAATYLWNDGSSTAAITVNPALTTTYTVTGTAENGCTATASRTVTVNAIPETPVASSNSPVIAGQTIFLIAMEIPGATYSWTGPNGFTSNSQSPVINNATTSNSGEYTVVATVNGCPSAAASTMVLVNPASSIKISELNGLMIAPNPFRYSTTLSFTVTESKRLTLSVTDISGREIEKRLVEAAPGVNVFEVGRDLISGTYLLSIDTGNEIQTLKMVVVK